ncbi:MAG: phosphoglycerate dehydrogenase, partial [Acidobacteriota bacterium]
MFRIVVSDKLSQNGLDQLESRANVLTDYCPGLDPRELAGRLSQAEGLIVRSGTKVTSELLATAPQLRVIGRAGIGVDNIDVQAATERGIVVLNTPDANATTTAELTIAHVLSLSRHLPAADRSVRAGEWNRSAFVGTEVAGKTLGIIGFGTIGRIVAARAQGLGMRVVAHDPFVTHEAFEQASVEPLELELLLQQADY